jgi:hypothetical protein
MSHFSLAAQAAGSSRSAAPCRSHSDIHGGMPCPWVYISPLWHKLVVVAALHRVDPILIYTWRNAMSGIFLPVAQAAGSCIGFAHRSDSGRVKEELHPNTLSPVQYIHLSVTGQM